VRTVFLAAIASMLGGARLSAQSPPPILDNSFLMEEAYNQEWGVVQHISLFTRERGRSWSYSFTQEWPFRSQRHQLSVTMPILHADGPGGLATGLGDVAVNYRFQLMGKGDGRAWIAPRLSVLLPTGRRQANRGEGVIGGQLAVPVSLQLSERVATHLNAGVSLHPRALDENGERVTRKSYSAGASIIYFLSPTVNLLLESVVENNPGLAGPGLTVRETSVFVSPGIRWAYNFRSGLQIVPGLAYTRGLDSARDESGLLLYLSVEHPFKRRNQ